MDTKQPLDSDDEEQTYYQRSIQPKPDQWKKVHKL